MSSNNEHHQKSSSLLGHFWTVRTFFLMIMGSITIFMFSLLLWAGVTIMNSLIYQFGTEILQEKLNSIIHNLDQQYSSPNISKIGSHSVRLHEIKDNALEDLSRFRYKDSGSVFVIQNDKTILLSVDFNTGKDSGFIPFYDTLTQHKKLVQYRSGTVKKMAVYTFYQPWQSYIGISIDQNELFALTNLFIKISLLVVSAFILSLILFTFVIQRKIITPLIRLSHFAGQITEGKYDATPEGTYIFELGELKSHMLQMASTLQWEMKQAKEKLELLREREANLDSALTALRKSEKKYRTIYDAPTDAIFILDPDTGRILDANKAMLMMFGYKENELKNLTLAQLSCGDPPYTEHEANTRISRATKTGWQFFEWLVKKSNGEPFWVEISLRLADIEDQRQLIAIVRNIHIRKMAEHELSSEKEQLAITLRSIGDGVITTDMRGRIHLVNRAAENLTGWSQAEAAGRSLNEILRLVQSDHDEHKIDPVENILSSGQPLEPTEENLLDTREGDKINIMVSGTPITDENDALTGAVIIFRDITEKKRLEEELFRINKLESVGVLAGGIAHDFNNILTAILGNVSLARQHPEDEVMTSDLLKKTEKAALRAKDLTSQLLTFSHGGEPVLQLSSLEPVIRKSVESAMHGSKITMHYDIPEDLWHVEIDPGQINQVLQNLFLNARQAMDEAGGILEISGRNIESCDLNQEDPASNCVNLIIRDNGCGIPAESIAKIFDPYFTTKTDGNGLGLAICHSIINKHNGQISVQSEPGSGTTVTIQLPVATDDEQIQHNEHDFERMNVKNRKARILIMDDDQMIIDLSRQILEHLGHEVVTSEDGQTALRYYAKAMDEKNPFDIVILDLTVPKGMGGRETITELIRLDPDVKAIVSSGYSHDPVMSEYEKYGFKAVIVKPYQVEELKNVVLKTLH